MQEGKEDVSETGPGINMTAQGTGKEKEVIGPGAFKQSGERTAKTEDGKGVPADKVSPKTQLEVSDDSKEEESVVAASRGKTKEKPTSAVKEEKGQEKTSEAAQEKSHEPIRAMSAPSGKDEVVHTTVNAGNQEDLEAKLSEMLLKQINNGKKELDVQLEPYNLGKIRIKVSYEDNQVSVSVLCTENSTLKLLSQSAGDLGTILASNLERPVQIFVDKQEADYLNNQQEQQGGGQQQQQQQENRQEDNREDFIQKLRLGIFEMDGSETDNK
ncbi:MAG: flagellar hook-length control protein FliK [Lacrimispora sp.]